MTYGTDILRNPRLTIAKALVANIAVVESMLTIEGSMDALESFSHSNIKINDDMWARLETVVHDATKGGDTEVEG
jgi:hypothetical protein